MFSLRRVEPDSFLQYPDQSTTTPLSSHSPHYYRGGREDAGSQYDWQPFQDGHMRVSFLPEHAYGNSQAAAALINATRFIGARNDFRLSTSNFDPELFELPGYFDGLYDFSGSLGTIWPQDPDTRLNSQFGNVMFGSLSPSTTLASPPSMPSLLGHSTINQIVLNEPGDSDSVGRYDMQCASLLDPANDQLLPVPAGCLTFLN